MGPKERRAREREETRTTILDAARELFAAEGYEAVTMRRIAERIEYSPTAIYFHFKDKEALMGKLCAVDFHTLAMQFTKIAKVADPVERLRRIGHAYAEFAAEYPNHYRLMFMTPHPPGDIPDEVMQRRIETVFQAMMQTPRPPAGPSRDDMVALVAEAAESASSPA